MVPEESLVNMIKAQIKLERNTTRKIRDLEEAITNLAAKLLLAEMRFDSEKHAKILQTMLDLMNQYEADQRSRRFWQIETSEYVDALVAKKMVEDHVKVEMNMLRHVKAEMKKTDDAALKLLFKHIISDEIKHHRIMETILKRAFKMVSIPHTREEAVQRGSTR